MGLLDAGVIAKSEKLSFRIEKDKDGKLLYILSIL